MKAMRCSEFYSIIMSQCFCFGTHIWTRCNFSSWTCKASTDGHNARVGINKKHFPANKWTTWVLNIWRWLPFLALVCLCVSYIKEASLIQEQWPEDLCPVVISTCWIRIWSPSPRKPSLKWQMWEVKIYRHWSVSIRHFVTLTSCS